MHIWPNNTFSIQYSLGIDWGFWDYAYFCIWWIHRVSGPSPGLTGNSHCCCILEFRGWENIWGETKRVKSLTDHFSLGWAILDLGGMKCVRMRVWVWVYCWKGKVFRGMAKTKREALWDNCDWEWVSWDINCKMG